MPDTPLTEAELERAADVIRDAAEHILRTFASERVSVSVALGICGIVVSRLLEHAPHHRAEFIACLQDQAEPDA